MNPSDQTNNQATKPTPDDSGSQQAETEQDGLHQHAVVASPSLQHRMDQHSEAAIDTDNKESDPKGDSTSHGDAVRASGAPLESKIKLLCKVSLLIGALATGLNYVPLEVNGVGLMSVTALWTILVLFATWSADAIRKWWKQTDKFAPNKSAHDNRTDTQEGELLIIEALKKWDSQAIDYRNARSKSSFFAALLGPTAVFCLSLQILAIHQGIGAYLLIVAESILIGFALFTVYQDYWSERITWHPAQHHKNWLPARLAAEILKKELSLYRAGIGPYLRCYDEKGCYDEKMRDAKASDRLHEIKRATKRASEISDPELNYDDLVDFLGMEHLEENQAIYWRDDLEDHREKQQLPIKKRQVVQYIEERLQDQIYYFGSHKERHRLLDLAYECVAQLGLWFALCLAVLHIKLIGSQEDGNIMHRAVDISALVMPMVGAASILIRNSFENHRLHLSYEDQYSQLEELKKRFDVLQANWPDPADAEHQHHFRRLVIRTETMLSMEIRRWWLIVRPESPQGN